MSYECPCPGGAVNTPDPDFKVEAVVVCDRYSDFLRCTLPGNKHLFDRIVVVTSAEDRDTQRICEFHHVECLQTDALNSRWNKFCKGAGINEGLSRLDRNGWVVHLDADIALPPQTRLLLQNAHLGEYVCHCRQSATRSSAARSSNPAQGARYDVLLCRVD